MALWGGRFNQGPAESVATLSRSVHFDWVLAPYDIRVNISHVRGLAEAGILNDEDAKKIVIALVALGEEIAAESFGPIDTDEDVHSAIERGLIAKLGELGGAFRAGRSRNDLVVTDFKLYLIDHMIEIGAAVTLLIEEFTAKADEYKDSIAPGFTHLQHAQPINFGHELAKHSQALLRDLSRIRDWLTRNSISPLGAGALAGSALQPHPEKSALDLGFTAAHQNSIDAVSDRDFVAEALFVMAGIGVHLSRIGEEYTLWSTTEFGWAKLDDAFSTGSSIMPQKKNPDIAELARGKSGRLIGNLTSVLTMLKGLPFAYNRDLQEDKEPTFDSVNTLLTILPALTGMVETTTFNLATMAESAVKGHALATEIADYLARHGTPFSEAHEIAGKCVRLAESNGVVVHELSDSELLSIDSRLTSSVRHTLTAAGGVDSRTSLGGTSTQSIIKQIHDLNNRNQLFIEYFDSKRSDFLEMINI
jgi:argininosuccinate lyase